MQFQAQSKRPCKSIRSPPTHQIGKRTTPNMEANKTKNADCICNLRMQSAFVNQLALNQAKSS
ncbi:hypothetical protein K9E44_03200 [Gardnerella vaginalis]|uniref:hypothetical protein n=1 Tax=Gardnerella vaginalis TaxID=2702 RepID=UPI00200C82AF|nr:hypothetical protein [Gardnerella vaginalis]UQA80324.1 hypothetical protein K9E44_03200 [Gardnerella vaginalis]